MVGSGSFGGGDGDSNRDVADFVEYHDDDDDDDDDNDEDLLAPSANSWIHRVK